jgi:membrane protease YdiL (CAAX protease family)
MMSLFDDNPLKPPEGNFEPLSSSGQATETPSVTPLAPSLAGDPISYAAVAPPTPMQKSGLPDDLRISWSWLHLLMFSIFGVISLLVVQTVFAIVYIPRGHHFADKHALEQFVLSNPFFAIGSMVIWESSLILFLYVTLAVLPNAPFWRSLGWHSLNPRDPALPRNPWLYFLCGCALSTLVFVVTAATKAPENAPIQEVLKHRSTLLFFMAMAVLFAPLVEETLFRGYLYPLFAGFSSALSRLFGLEPSAAARRGIVVSIILTGVLFGLVHGYQLGWSGSLVLILVLVGIVFTYVRARTGTVYASYLLHLGYNSTIAFFTLIGFLVTKGFTHLPPHR